MVIKYSARTNAKGIAKVTIKRSSLRKLKVGKRIKYQAKYGSKTSNRYNKVKRQINKIWIMEGEG